MDEYEFGVSYHVGLDGRPVQALVEPSDDWRDAESWRIASGDPDARVVRRLVQGGPWEVTA